MLIGCIGLASRLGGGGLGKPDPLAALGKRDPSRAIAVLIKQRDGAVKRRVGAIGVRLHRADGGLDVGGVGARGERQRTGGDQCAGTDSKMR
jgi:hypothetical protein